MRIEIDSGGDKATEQTQEDRERETNGTFIQNLRFWSRGSRNSSSSLSIELNLQFATSARGIIALTVSTLLTHIVCLRSHKERKAARFHRRRDMERTAEA